MDLAPYSILVVDDIRFSRATLVRMLQGLGCKAIQEAADGVAALGVLESAARIDCVITDLEMPGMDGLSLLQAIRVGRGSIPRDLRVVLLTGYSDFERIGAALRLDLDAFVPKPASRQGLGECLSRLLGRSLGDAERIADADVYRAVDVTKTAQAPAEAPAPAEAMLRNEHCVPLNRLHLGSVLSRDLLFANGRLLLAAGTRINTRILRRLGELAPLAELPLEAWVQVLESE